MGTEFKAASGRTITIGSDGSLLFGRANGYLSRETAFDAEEYFRAKRDEELGQWRYPIDPDWVAVEGEPGDEGRRTVVLVNERTLERHWLNNRIMELPTIDDAQHRAGRAYFVAHPERKPWEDAKSGEVWILDANEFSGPNVVEENSVFKNGIGFRHAVTGVRGPGLQAPYIKSARRIWPEEAA